MMNRDRYVRGVASGSASRGTIYTDEASLGKPTFIQ